MATLLFTPRTTIDANVFQYRLDKSSLRAQWNVTTGAYEFQVEDEKAEELEQTITETITYDINGRFEVQGDNLMKNLIGETVKIYQFLTTDPYNKKGETGVVTDVRIIDEENADVTVKFEDGVIGLYEVGTFEITR